jgi:hypothetical protein
VKKIYILGINTKNSCIVEYRNLNTKDEKNILINKPKTAQNQAYECIVVK